MNKKKATNFGLDVFQGKVLFLNIILRLNFTREAEIDSTKQLSPSEFVYKFQNTTQKYKDCNFFLHWFYGLVYANSIIHLSVGEKPSIFTST